MQAQGLGRENLKVMHRTRCRQESGESSANKRADVQIVIIRELECRGDAFGWCPLPSSPGAIAKCRLRR